MKLRYEFLYPVDLGLEVEFTGVDAGLLVMPPESRPPSPLSFEGVDLASARTDTQLYRFGMGLVRVGWEFDATLEQCARLACYPEDLRIARAPLPVYCAEVAGELVARAARYATHRYDARRPTSELYPLVTLLDPIREPTGKFLEKHRKTIFGIVGGEPHYDRISEFALTQAGLENYGYYEHELLVVTRDGAVIAGEDAGRLEELVSLACVQAMNLRSYQVLLDRELSQAHRLLEGIPPYWRFIETFRKYTLLSREALDFDQDKLAIVESLYAMASLPQIESDWYLRTVYGKIGQRLDLEGLRREVEMKIDRLEESYNNAREFLSTSFFILLDIVVLFSLTLEIAPILSSILLWKMAGK